MSVLNKLKENQWSPYLVGGLIGVLVWVVFGLMNESVGVSTTFVRAIFLIENLIMPNHANQLTYFKEIISDKPPIDWQFAFVIGIFFGSFIAAYLANSFNTRRLPKIWEQSYGLSHAKRFIAAFFGGIILIIGARLAGGCTSGHGISGGLMLAISSWLFMIAAFLTGIPFAMFFYKCSRDTRGE